MLAAAAPGRQATATMVVVYHSAVRRGSPFAVVPSKAAELRARMATHGERRSTGEV